MQPPQWPYFPSSLLSRDPESTTVAGTLWVLTLYLGNTGPEHICIQSWLYWLLKMDEAKAQPNNHSVPQGV